MNHITEDSVNDIVESVLSMGLTDEQRIEQIKAEELQLTRAIEERKRDRGKIEERRRLAKSQAILNQYTCPWLDDRTKRPRLAVAIQAGGTRVIRQLGYPTKYGWMLIDSNGYHSLTMISQLHGDGDLAGLEARRPDWVAAPKYAGFTVVFLPEAFQTVKEDHNLTCSVPEAWRRPDFDYITGQWR